MAASLVLAAAALMAGTANLLFHGLLRGHEAGRRRAGSRAGLTTGAAAMVVSRIGGAGLTRPHTAGMAVDLDGAKITEAAMDVMSMKGNGLSAGRDQWPPMGLRPGSSGSNRLLPAAGRQQVVSVAAGDRAAGPVAGDVQ